MKAVKKLMSWLFVLALILSMSAMLTACNKDEKKDPDQSQGTVDEGNGENVETGSYTVNVKTMGGMVMSGIDVYIYADNTLADMKAYGETNESGNASFDLPVSSDYAIVLSGVPKGYTVESYYSFSGNTALIALSSSLITGENLSSATLGLGDIMYDFSVVTPEGETVTLSELLKEKKMVLLNFWYTTCTYCVLEFPYMEEAYQMYQDDIAIVALNPFNNDAEIKTFQEEQQLSFYMAQCQPAWASVFGIQGYPTSIAVDRYGVICLIEAGGITSLRPFTSMFEHFAAEDYQQKLCVDGVGSLISEIKPTHTMDSSEAIGEAINKGDIEVTYRPEEDPDSAEYAWPFIIGEKNGEKCIYTSNKEIDSSYAIIYADVTLKAGEAVGFDYLASTERLNDVMYVIVNDEDIYQISGVSDTEEWKTCYPCVALEDGTYEIALCYLKDESTNEGEDTIYIKNMRVVSAEEIDTETYLPRYAATSKDGFDYDYVDIFYNEKDGYYHVGSVDGPLLLADLMNYTLFNEEKTVWEMADGGEIVVDGHDYYEELVNYCSYASNSALTGVCTVNKELAELLKIVADVAGFDEGEDEWLKICKYYEVYGTDGKQLTDPIQGLAPFSAPEAVLGVGVETNYFYYDRAIIPRGMFAKFVPTKSGVYRITSHSTSANGVDGWIFDENKTELLVYEQDERMFNDSDNVSMVYYMEAGKEYYINIAFWDLYEVGYIPYDIEYVAADLDHFRLASPGYFTYDSDATGDAMYYVIGGGIDVVLGSDGYYYEDLGKDAAGNQKYGSMIYADFTGITALFSSPIATVYAYDENGKVQLDENGDPIKVLGMIDLQGFDFSKTEEDLYILGIMKKYNNDIEAADEYLKTLWGEEYEAYAEIYQLEDVYEGRYHGEGEDLTEEISAYLDKVLEGSQYAEREGCVPVDENLAEILHKLMDKYTFENVDYSWLKLCYYYDYLGPEQ